jgi:Spy/CpxP family protein refolding chaperone
VDGSAILQVLLTTHGLGRGGIMQRLALLILFVLTFILVGNLHAEPADDASAKSAKGAESTKATKSAEKKAPKAKKPGTPAKDVEVIEVELDAKDMAKAKAQAKAKAKAAAQTKTGLWWNEPGIVKALSLTEKQRKKMGEFHRAFRKTVPENRKMEAFHETLIQGNWKKARAENEKNVKGAMESVRMRGTFKIDILSQLNKEQLQKLVDGYPRLIYKPWRRAMNSDAP